MEKPAKGSPLPLLNGAVVHGNGSVEPPPELDDNGDVTSEELVQRLETTRTLVDVPFDAQRMNFLGLIFFYRAWGLKPYDIAVMLNTSADAITAIMDGPDYERLSSQAIENIRAAELKTVHGILAANAGRAARTVARMVGDVKNKDRALTASRDILDRMGFSAAQRHEHSHNVQNTLRIVVLEEDKQIKLPTIDLGASEYQEED